MALAMCLFQQALQYMMLDIMLGIRSRLVAQADQELILEHLREMLREEGCSAVREILVLLMLLILKLIVMVVFAFKFNVQEAILSLYLAVVVMSTIAPAAKQDPVAV